MNDPVVKSEREGFGLGLICYFREVTVPFFYFI